MTPYDWLGTLWLVGIAVCFTVYYVFKRYFEYKLEKARIETERRKR